jgi:hypothetical protein
VNTSQRNKANKLVHAAFEQYAPMLATSVACLFIILGVLAYGIVNTNNRARDVQDRQVRIAACILEQLAEHRKATREHHADSFKNNNPGDVIDLGKPPLEPTFQACGALKAIDVDYDRNN